MTSSAENSRWVNLELLRAEELSKPIFPLLLEGRPFFRLADLQYEDVTNGRMPDPEFVERVRRTADVREEPSLVDAATRQAKRPAAAKDAVQPSLAFKRRAIRLLAIPLWIVATLLWYALIETSFAFFFESRWRNTPLPPRVTGQIVLAILVALVTWCAFLLTNVGRLEVNDKSLVWRTRRKRATYFWDELERVEFRGGALVVFPKVDSPLAEQMRMSGMIAVIVDGIVVCRLKQLRASPSDIFRAVRRYYPTATSSGVADTTQNHAASG
jgi:hypothetical protein